MGSQADFHPIEVTLKIVATGPSRRARLVADAPTRDVFADETLLAATGVRPPQITRLGNRLGFTALSVAELAACTRKEARS